MVMQMDVNEVDRDNKLDRELRWIDASGQVDNSE